MWSIIIVMIMEIPSRLWKYLSLIFLSLENILSYIFSLERVAYPRWEKTDPLAQILVYVIEPPRGPGEGERAIFPPITQLCPWLLYPEGGENDAIEKAIDHFLSFPTYCASTSLWSCQVCRLGYLDADQQIEWLYRYIPSTFRRLGKKCRRKKKKK